MLDFLAIATIVFWLIIPIFWIPVHFFSASQRKIGLKAYLMSVAIWLPLCFLVFEYRAFLLHYRLAVSLPGALFGWLVFACGILLHIWTARLLGIWTIIGVPEVSARARTHVVTEGPFSIVRHPTYLAHTLIFAGTFLITGVLAVGIVTVLDFFVVNTLIIPLEERELASRFGEEFTKYRAAVRYRCIPGIL